MRPIKDFPQKSKTKIRYVLTDIDDTLTVCGRLPSVVFEAMERLQHNNIRILPITGRPAGWCDHMARMWPIDGVVGENGAFYFRYDLENKKMIRRYFKPQAVRRQDQMKLTVLEQEILQTVPGSRVSADQAYREADLAIDFCEDVPRLSQEAIDKIVEIFHRSGARAKISSIHVNGWFGDYDKLSMTKLFFKEVFRINLDETSDQMLFIGDSPNDCPMFEFFTHAVGVANIREFESVLTSKPQWITEKQGGFGFEEIATTLLN
jgi:HAD superfamily hydrolase (TIGR01484 family)